MTPSPTDRTVGTRIVIILLLFAAARAHAQSLPRLEATARIGCATCEGPAAFAGIQRLVVDPAGNIHVLDSAEPYVRVFTAKGEPVRTFGKRGGGPGEFRLPAFMAVTHDGSYSIVDIRSRRLSRLSADGTELSAVTFRRFPVAAAAWGDTIWLATTDFVTPTLTIERWTGGDTILPVRSLGPDSPRRDETTPSSIVALAASPDGGFAIGDGATFYRIGVYDATGNRTADITRDVARLKRTPAELEAEEARLARAASRMEAMRRAEGGSAATVRVPELKQHFLSDALVYDARGRLWVRTERGSRDDVVFDVFAPDRRYLGEVRAPGRMRNFAIGQDLLAGVVYDADEAQYVQVCRIID